MQSEYFRHAPAQRTRWSGLNHRDSVANQQTPAILEVTWPGGIGHDSPQGIDWPH